MTSTTAAPRRRFFVDGKLVANPHEAPAPPPSPRTHSRFSGVVYASHRYTEYRRADGATYTERHEPRARGRRHGEQRRNWRGRTQFPWWDK